MPAPEIVHLVDPLDFLAELTQHIPPARVQLIRAMVCTPHVSKATGRAWPTFYSGRHQVGRAK